MSLADRFAPRQQFVAFADQRIGARRQADIEAALTVRQLEVLRSLALLHFATTEQVARLHFDDTASPSAGRRARRTLGHLYRQGLLERLDRRIGGARPGSGNYVWRLSAAGARITGPPRALRRHEPGLLHLAHVLDVAELVVRLRECERAGGVELIDIESEPACWRWYVGASGRRECLKPDLRVTVAVGGYALHWFVEVDRGTESRKRLTIKALTYLAARSDGGEQERAGCFPRVLWVVPDQHRADALVEVCDSLRAAPAGLFVVAVADRATTTVISGRNP